MENLALLQKISCYCDCDSSPCFYSYMGSQLLVVSAINWKHLDYVTDL